MIQNKEGKVSYHGTNKPIFSRHGKTWQADAKIRDSLHYFTACRGIVQYRRPDFHRQRRLSRLLRQRRKYGRISAHRHRPGHRRHDRGRLLCLCQPKPWQETPGGCKYKRGKRHRIDGGQRHYPMCRLSPFSRANHCHVRRYRKCGNIPAFKGIFLLHFPRHPVLYVRASG